MNEIQESWVKIKGFEHRYMISNKGRVLSIGRVLTAKDGFVRNYPNKFLKLKPHKSNGYCYARLYKDDGKTYEHISVHRLVALHFIENSNNLPVVNHIDTNRSNNNIGNLEWVTVAQNLTHHGCHLRGGEKRKKKVFQYKDNGEFVQAWTSVRDAQEYGFNVNMVRKVCLGYRKRYKGFRWSYD